jgi:anti-sigma B factor antagonist
MASPTPCLKISESEGVRTVQFHEQQILDEEKIERFQQELDALIESSDRPLILIDFHNVNQLSSACLGALVGVNHKVKQKQGQLRLANIAPRLMEVFTITGLDKTLRISSTRTGAMSILTRIAREGAMDSP